MRDDEVTVMQDEVYNGVGEYEPCEPTKAEWQQESKYEEQRSDEVEQVGSQSQQPVQQLYARWYGDDACGWRKVCSRIDIKSNNEHMMPPHDAPEQANQEQCYHHAIPAEYDELRKLGYDRTNKPKAR